MEMEEQIETRSREGSPLAPAAALEWDPSADVGTPVPANTPVHGPKTSKTQLHFDDLNTLEQIMLSLTVDPNSSLNRQHQEFIASSTPVDSKLRPVETSSPESTDMIGQSRKRPPQNEVHSPYSYRGTNEGEFGTAVSRPDQLTTGTSAAISDKLGHSPNSTNLVNLLPRQIVVNNSDARVQVGLESVLRTDQRIGTTDTSKSASVDVGTTKTKPPSIADSKPEYQNWIGPRTYAETGTSTYRKVEIVVPSKEMILDKEARFFDHHRVVDQNGVRSMTKGTAASVATQSFQTKINPVPATSPHLVSSKEVETVFRGSLVQESDDSAELKNMDKNNGDRLESGSSNKPISTTVCKAKSVSDTATNGDGSPKSDSDRSTGSTNSSYRTATEDVDEPPLETSSFANVSWQTSGITKSELEYRSKKNGSSSDHSSSSLLWVEVQADDVSRVSKSISDNVNKRPSSSVRVLAGARHQSEPNSSSKTENEVNDVETENVLMKHKLYRHRQRVSQCRSARCQCACPCNSHVSKKKISILTPPPVQDHHQSGRIIEPGTGRSLGSEPPQSLEGMNIHDSAENSVTSVSNGEITPTCEFLTKLLNEEDAAVRKYGYEFLELHRNSLVTKMRKEFQHLEKLNRMLSPASVSKKAKVLQTHGQNTDSCSGTDARIVEQQHTKVQKATKRIRAREEPSMKVDWSSTSAEPSSGSSKDTNPRTRIRNAETVVQQTAATVYSQRVISGQSNGICSQKPISYFVPFTERIFPTREPSLDKENRRPMSSAEETDESYMFVNEFLQINLRQAFEHNCPTIKANLEQREQMIQHLKQGRKIEQQVKREYFASHNTVSPNQSLNEALPRKEPRVMSFKEMKTLKDKKLKHLPEVREKIDRMKKEEDKKTNRLLTQVFSRKLRQHALKGDTNIPYAKSLIRH